MPLAAPLLLFASSDLCRERNSKVLPSLQPRRGNRHHETPLPLSRGTAGRPGARGGEAWGPRRALPQTAAHPHRGRPVTTGPRALLPGGEGRERSRLPRAAPGWAKPRPSEATARLSAQRGSRAF